MLTLHLLTRINFSLNLHPFLSFPWVWRYRKWEMWRKRKELCVKLKRQPVTRFLWDVRLKRRKKMGKIAESQPVTRFLWDVRLRWKKMQKSWKVKMLCFLWDLRQKRKNVKIAFGISDWEEKENVKFAFCDSDWKKCKQTEEKCNKRTNSRFLWTQTGKEKTKCWFELKKQTHIENKHSFPSNI